MSKSEALPVLPAIGPSSSTSSSSTRLKFADFKPMETKVCATCKRCRTMSKFSDYQYNKEFGDCLDCILLYGKGVNEANKQRLSSHFDSLKKSQSPRRNSRQHSAAFDRIVINTLQEGVKLFHELDLDGNNTLSRSELFRGMYENKKFAECLLQSRFVDSGNIDPYAKLFSSFDMDSNGEIDLNEFLTILKQIHNDIYEEEEVFLRHENELLVQEPLVEASCIDEEDSTNQFCASSTESAVMKKLTTLEFATRPSAEAVKRSKFQSPHRRFRERKNKKVDNEEEGVKDLTLWSVSKQCQSPHAEEPLSPRSNHKNKRFYSYQTSDGCLIMHELDNKAENSHLMPQKPHWEDISSVSDMAAGLNMSKRTTSCQRDCSPKKRIFCWKENDVSSSSDDDDD